MTTTQRPKAAHWTCRLALPSTFAYLVSSTKPERDPATGVVTWTPIPGYGDEITYIDWAQVVGMFVREVEAEKPVVPREPVARASKAKSKSKSKQKDEKPQRMTLARIREHAIERFPTASLEQIEAFAQSEAIRLKVTD